VEEKRRLFTRMSKYSLQQEEKDSFLAHQRDVDERRILEAPHTLSSSPLRQQPQQQQQVHQSQAQAQAAQGPDQQHYFDTHSSAPTSTVQRISGGFTTTSAASASDYLLSGLSTSAPVPIPVAVPTVPRPQSSYLKEVLQSSHIPSARTSTESNTNHPLGTQSHLKAELTQLDVEIGKCALSFGLCESFIPDVYFSQIFVEQLKEKLGKAAMLRSQRILSEVLDAHAPVYHQ